MASTASRRTASGRALTLVELLVAVALSLALIGVMTFVWTQSNRIFSTQINRIEAYQRVRVVMDSLERDLANTEPTGDMEFYSDEDQDGLYRGIAEGGVDQPFRSPTGDLNFRAPNDLRDPLYGQPEFALPEGDLLNTPGFVRAPTIVSPDPYQISTDGYLDRRSYWRDEVYVRSFVTIGSTNRPALIHYRLVQPETGGSSLLRRRIWFLDPAGHTPANQFTDQTDQVSILAGNVCDLKIGFLFKPNPLSNDLNKYHVAPKTEALGQGYSGPHADSQNLLLSMDKQRGFVSTYEGNEYQEGDSNHIEPLSAQHRGGPTDSQRVSFLFEGNARLEEREQGVVALRGLRGDAGELADMRLGPGSVGFEDYDNFDFRGVRPGTRVLVSGATDDDPQQSPGASQAAGARFPPRLLTVQAISAEGASATNSDHSYVSLQFQERINFSRLRANWLGSESPVTVPESAYLPLGPNTCGPARVIKSSFNVRYRVGFLPAAFVIRISLDDRNNQKVIPMERVVRLLQQ